MSAYDPETLAADPPSWAFGAVTGVIELGSAALGATVGAFLLGLVAIALRGTLGVALAGAGLALGALAGLGGAIHLMRDAGASAPARAHVLVFVLALVAGLGTGLSPLRAGNRLGGAVSASLATAVLAGAALLSAPGRRDEP